MDSKRAGWLGLRLLVLAALLIGLYYWVDWSSLMKIVRTLPPWVVLAVLLSGTASRLTCALRWNTVCGGLMDKPPGTFHLYLLGMLAEFVNLWVPSSLGGEAARIWGVQKVADVPRATASVAVDRVLGLAGLILSLLPVAFLVPLPFPIWVLPLAVAAVAVGVALALFFRDGIAGLAPWANALAGLSAARVLTALGISTLAPWCIVAGYVVFFGAVHPLALGEVAGFLLITRFGRAVPISIFGVNSVEGSMLLLGEMFGIPREVVTLSVAMNFTDKLLHSLAGGVVNVLLGGGPSGSEESVATPP